MPDCRLIYKSIADLDRTGPEELAAMVARSAEKNEKSNITGLLALFGDQFVQVLEGPAPAVNALYGKIMADARHRKLELVDYSEIAARSFPDWGMRIVDLADQPLAVRKEFLTKFPSRDGEVLVPDSLPAVFSLMLDARTVELKG